MRRISRSILTFILLFGLFAGILFVVANWAAIRDRLGFWFGSDRFGQEQVDGFGQHTEVIPEDDRLIIPRLAVNAPLLFPEDADEQSILEALQDGVARYPDTALPGEVGNFFVTGHSSQLIWEEGKYKNVFSLLEKLTTDDVVLVYYHKQKFVYTVSDSKTVEPDDLSVLEQTDQPILTLMTCWPTGTTARRLIVSALLDRESSGVSEEAEDTREKAKDSVQPGPTELPAIR